MVREYSSKIEETKRKLRLLGSEDFKANNDFALIERLQDRR